MANKAKKVTKPSKTKTMADQIASSNNEDSAPKKPNVFKDAMTKTKQGWNKIPYGFRVAIVITAFVGLALGLGLAFSAGKNKPTAKSSAMTKRSIREAQILLRKAAKNNDPVLALGEACYAVSYVNMANELSGEAEASKLSGTDTRELAFYAKELQNSAIQNVYAMCPGVDPNDITMASPVKEDQFDVDDDFLPPKKKKSSSHHLQRAASRLEKETYMPPR